MTGAGGYDPGEASHRALREVRRSLERHPAVEYASGFPTGSFTRVEADLDPRVLGREAETATLTVRWFAGESPETDPQFSVHYSDGTGFDCGWHHEPNPHVDGWGHYQERNRADGEYTYTETSFDGRTPGRILWDVLSRLEDRLGTDD